VTTSSGLSVTERKHDKRTLEAFLRSQDPQKWDNFPLMQENVYTCMTGHMIVTRDADVGTTPARMACRVKDCQDIMISHGYPAMVKSRSRIMQQPTYEWFRPEANALGLFGPNQEIHDYIVRGGLQIRKIED
jgi:hypothetical protein